MQISCTNVNKMFNDHWSLETCVHVIVNTQNSIFLYFVVLFSEVNLADDKSLITRSHRAWLIQDFYESQWEIL